MNGESFYKPSAALDLMANLGRIDGGCDDCASYQTIEQVERGVYRLTIHHDASCPTYHQIVATRSETS